MKVSLSFDLTSVLVFIISNIGEFTWLTLKWKRVVAAGGYDCHSVQLVLDRTRGLVASEVAMGGTTSNQE